MAQLGGQPVPKKDASPLSDDLDSQTPLRITEFKRDILGRLIHTLARDGGDRVQETAYQYDPNGNLVRAANRHSITSFDYNGNDQLIAQHQWKVPSKEENARNGLPETDWRDAQYDMLCLPVTETVRYHYDFNGNRTATVLPDGRQINYLYYGSGHLHQISLDDEVITDIERDRLHREIFRTQGKLASRYELDPLGRLKKQIATLNDLTEGGKGKTKVAAGYGQTAVKRSYGYDRTGNLTHSTDQRTGTTKFEYDKLGRITKAGNELFAFDPAHNILDIPTEKVKPYPAPSPVGEGRGESKTTALLSDNRSAITDNRLKTYNGTTYYYDDLGNLIHRELADGEVQNYFYDLHDQLVKAEIFKKDGTKETWSYTYDALGRRIGKGRLKNEEISETSFSHDLSGNDLENQTRFVWDGSHLLQEVYADGRYTYIYTDQDSYEPLAQVHDWTTEDGESRQQTRYFHCDQIGIPREMTDKDGNLLWFGNYTGWGRLKEETKVTDSAYQPFRLQNQYADRETGLHYNFFRYYEPDAGRFVNQDPIGLRGGDNLYRFSSNIQIWIDPLGLACIPNPNRKNDEDLARRIDKLSDNLTEKNRDGFTTLALARVTLADGTSQIWIAQAGSSLSSKPSRRQQSLAGADEIIQNLHPAGRSGKDGNHLNDAERQLIREAKKRGAKIKSLGATKPMCGRCEKGARRAGILRRIITPIKSRHC